MTAAVEAADSATIHTATVDPVATTAVTVDTRAATIVMDMLHAELTATADATTVTLPVVVMTAVEVVEDTPTATTVGTVVTVEETAMVDAHPVMLVHQPPMVTLLHAEMPESHTEVDTMIETSVVPIKR